MARRPTPIIDAAVEKFKENRPMVGAIVEGLRNAAANRNNSMKPEDVEVVANEVVATMANAALAAASVRNIAFRFAVP